MWINLYQSKKPIPQKSVFSTASFESEKKLPNGMYFCSEEPYLSQLQFYKQTYCIYFFSKLKIQSIFQRIINYVVILYRKVMYCPIANSMNPIKKFFPKIWEKLHSNTHKKILNWERFTSDKQKYFPSQDFHSSIFRPPVLIHFYSLQILIKVPNN